MIFRWITQKLKYRNQFYPYEYKVLEALILKLDHNACEILKYQMTKVSLYKRENLLREVGINHLNIYQLKDATFKFIEERELARVILCNIDNNLEMNAKIIIRRGCLADIIFNKPPKEFFRGVSLSDAKVSIKDVKIWCDPMVVPSTIINQQINSKTLRGWVKSCHDRKLFTELYKPLPVNELDSYINAVDAKLPDDYIQYLKQADYGILDGCIPRRYLNIIEHEKRESGFIIQNAIKGFRTINPISYISYDENSYYLLADMGLIGAIAIKDGDYTGQMILLEYSDMGTELLLKTGSFVEAINKVLGLVYEKCEVSTNDQVFI